MIINEIIKSAFKSLMMNKKRSILTMIGIVIGISSVITIISLGNGIKYTTMKSLQSSNEKSSSSISYYSNTNDPNGFTKDDLQLINEYYSSKVKKLKIVQNNMLSFNGNIGNAFSNFTGYLTYRKPTIHLLSGRNINRYDNSLRNDVALISSDMGKNKFYNYNNAIGNAVTINGKNYTIIGVYKNNPISNYNSDFIIPKSSYMFNNSSLNGNKIYINYYKNYDVKKNTHKIMKLLQKYGSHHKQGSYDDTNIGQFVHGIGKIIDGVTYFVSAIAGISLFIAGVGIMNMMYISVSERENEIGIKLSIGATKKDILLQFLFESIILTVVGGILGFSLGAISSIVISLLLPFNAIITWTSFLLSFIVSLFIGIIFGIFPAQKAANKNLIDILH